MSYRTSLRHDALTHCIALLHRAIFWFSPLSWWLPAHIAELAEQASDEAALSGGADRNHYARTLFGFFRNPACAPQTRLVAGRFDGPCRSG